MKITFFCGLGGGLGATLLIFGACGGTTIVDGAGGDGAGAGGASATTTTTTTTGTTSGGGFGACNGPGECVLTHPGCCPSCTTPEAGDLASVHAEQLAAFQQAECPTPMGCPECIACPNPHLFPRCDDGTCAVGDLRDHPAGMCNEPSDCVLRAGLGCCEACDAGDPTCGDLVAVNAAAMGALLDEVCSPFAGACPPCAPIYPADASPDCIDGRCAVVLFN